MDPGKTELPQPKPNWDSEKQKAANSLTSEFESVRPQTHEASNILVVAKSLYGQTREQVQPFLDSLFEEGENRYFKTLVSKAFIVHSSQNPRKGEPSPTKTYEQMIEESSNEIVSNIADFYDQREQLKSKGLTEQQESPSVLKWTRIRELQKDFLLTIDNFDQTVLNAKESGAHTTNWLNGLRAIQAKYHNRLNSLNEDSKKIPRVDYQSRERLPDGRLSVRLGSRPDRNSKEFNENLDKLKSTEMEFIDDLELALPSINKFEWAERLRQVQNNAIDVLDQNGISRLLPKPGQEFDPKWQMATRGEGQKVSKVQRGAFIDKPTGNVIQEALVETS